MSKKRQTQDKVKTKKTFRTIVFPRGKRDPEYIETAISQALASGSLASFAMTENHDFGSLAVSLVLQDSGDDLKVKAFRSAVAETFQNAINDFLESIHPESEVVEFHQSATQGGILSGVLFYR